MDSSFGETPDFGSSFASINYPARSGSRTSLGSTSSGVSNLTNSVINQASPVQGATHSFDPTESSPFGAVYPGLRISATEAQQIIQQIERENPYYRCNTCQSLFWNHDELSAHVIAQHVPVIPQVASGPPPAFTWYTPPRPSNGTKHISYTRLPDHRYRCYEPGCTVSRLDRTDVMRHFNRAQQMGRGHLGEFDDTKMPVMTPEWHELRFARRGQHYYDGPVKRLYYYDSTHGTMPSVFGPFFPPPAPRYRHMIPNGVYNLQVPPRQILPMPQENGLPMPSLRDVSSVQNDHSDDREHEAVKEHGFGIFLPAGSTLYPIDGEAAKTYEIEHGSLDVEHVVQHGKIDDEDMEE